MSPLLGEVFFCLIIHTSFSFLELSSSTHSHEMRLRGGSTVQYEAASSIPNSSMPHRREICTLRSSATRMTTREAGGGNYVYLSAMAACPVRHCRTTNVRHSTLEELPSGRNHPTSLKNRIRMTNKFLAE